jgi:hypothetical protein
VEEVVVVVDGGAVGLWTGVDQPVGSGHSGSDSNTVGHLRHRCCSIDLVL